MMMEKVNFGVIGAGGIARRKTIPGMLKAKSCRLVAVMDVEGADEVAGEFQIPRHYSREEELACDPEVQAVYIASPVHLHKKHISLCARKKKHILCEKPLTLSSQEAREALKVCKANRVFLQEGYMMKFHGAHQRIMDLISAGRLGKIVYGRAQLSCWYPPIKGAWRQDARRGGGGSLMDMASHLLDLFESFSGPIKRVIALTGNLVHDYQPEDSSTVLLEFESGAHGTIDSFFCIPDEASRTRLEVYGSQGSVLAEGTIGQGSGGFLEGIFGLGDSGYEADQEKDVAPRFERISFPKINPYTAECEYFANCILENRPPAQNSGENAVHILQLIEKIYASARRGQFVKM